MRSISQKYTLAYYVFCGLSSVYEDNIVCLLYVMIQCIKHFGLCANDMPAFRATGYHRGKVERKLILHLINAVDTVMKSTPVCAQTHQ